MTGHLKALYVEAQFNGKPLTGVFVDGGAVLNVTALSILKKFGKSTKDLLNTYMKMNNCHFSCAGS